MAEVKKENPIFVRTADYGKSVTRSVPRSVPGSVTGSVTGSVPGSVPGSVSGSVSESVSRSESRSGSRSEQFVRDFERIIDNSSLYIYVIEPETYKILYYNNISKAAFGDGLNALPCYKALVGRDSSCPNCPLKSIDEDGRFVPSEVLWKDDKYVLVHASSVHWNGKDAYMMTCTDITKRIVAEKNLSVSSEEMNIVLRQNEKQVVRYYLKNDYAENMLENETILGYKGEVNNFSKLLVESGVINAESIGEYWRVINNMRDGIPSGKHTLLFNGTNGEKRFYHISYELIFNSDGTPSHAVILYYDKTDLREREIAYKKWTARLGNLLANKTPYIEANISKNIIERAENLVSKYNYVQNPQLTAYVRYTLDNMTSIKDAEIYELFFDIHRMLWMFENDQMHDKLDYRAVVNGKEKWYRIEMQMVQYPYSDDIKAFVMFHDIDAEVKDRELLLENATIDSLTGLLNRTSLEEKINDLIGASASNMSDTLPANSTNMMHTCGKQADEKENELEKVKFALFMIDIDNFKIINDTLGHIRGDETITRTSQKIVSVFDENFVAGRLGGDEFMIFLHGDWTVHDVERVSRRLVEALRFSIQGIAVSASIGIALSKSNQTSFKELYAQADKAMYSAKKSGKNQVCFEN